MYEFAALLYGHILKLHLTFIYSLKCNQQDARYTIFFITVTALHVSGGFSAHHQELKSCIHSMWHVPSLFAATASGCNTQTWHLPDAVYRVLELLMMGGETARNM
jgi:hypothetical protein